MIAGLGSRITRVQEAMRDTDLDLLLAVGRENLIYFTGLTEVECMAVLIPRSGDACAVTLWLDAPYVRRKSGLTTHGYVFPREKLSDKVIGEISRYGLNQPRIGFERYFIDFALYDGLRQAFPEATFIGAGDLFYKIRSVKDEQEINCIRRAADAVCCGMEAAIGTVHQGISELDILAEAEYAMLKAGSHGSPFRPQVVSGERTLLTHPVATEKKVAAGEIVVIHLGATWEGYCAKICRTVAVGAIPPGQAAIYALLMEARQRALEALTPGVPADQVDHAARAVVEAAGYGNLFLDQIGYGVGLRQSEFYPVIGRGRAELITEDMVVDLLLPTIYVPGYGGPRITDVIHVGHSGNLVLTDFPRELFQV